jgi:hypothetical protein
MPLGPRREELEPARVQLAVELLDERDRLTGQDLLRDGAQSRVAQNCVAQNWASSVEPTSASVEVSPLLTALATRSK